MVSTELLVQQVINGISIGSWLFLVAVGLSLIFGVLGVLNFAHGALFMVGAYTAIVVMGSVESFWVGVVLAMLVVGVVGVIIEMGFIRQLYGRAEEELDQLLMTFAFVLIITDSIRAIFGSGSVVTNPPNLLRGNIGLVGGYGIGTYRAFLIVASVAVMGAILLTLRSTNLGRLVRATSSDRDMALLLGIDVPRLYTLVFFIGAAMAGLGGALITPIQSLTPELGNQVIINAFVVVVIGGLGSFTGAFIGAYVIGIMIAVGSIYAAGAGQLFPFIALIAILLIRPEGLFGGIDS
jgi:branched-subunit amino acid ABC-type transport system permease component